MENLILEKTERAEVVIYQPEETTRLEVKVENDTVWLNRHQLAELFGRDIKTIGKHINNALNEELEGLAVVAKFATTAKPDSSSFKALFICFPMVFTSRPNRVANCCLLSHTVSSCSLTSSLVISSG